MRFLLALFALVFLGLLFTTEPSIGDWWRKRRGRG